MRVILLGEPLRTVSRFGETCASCAHHKARTAPFLVPSTPTGSFTTVYFCTGCLRAALRTATAGLKRERSS